MSQAAQAAHALERPAERINGNGQQGWLEEG